MRDDTEWFWDKQHDCAFNEPKKCISSSPVLAYYNPKLPVTIYADALQNGLGCVCLQEGKPIAYASRSLTKTEKRYAQIEKEQNSMFCAAVNFSGMHTKQPFCMHIPSSISISLVDMFMQKQTINPWLP